MCDELERTAGDRMPEFEDVPNLPVCRAVIKEVLRWRPVTVVSSSLAGHLVTLGLPAKLEIPGVLHQLIVDDVYNGYFFPKGTTVHANRW